jgi:Sulfotransferase family
MALADPLIILAPPRSYTTIICAMLGQHPQMYGVPETHLFVYDTMREWEMAFGRNFYADGLLRAVAEVIFGNQNAATIERARRWLWRRLRWDTGDVLWELAERIHPRILVEKTPMTTYRVEYMQRALDTCPRARFLHLVRHPLGYGQSILKYKEQFAGFRGTLRVAGKFYRRLNDRTNGPARDLQLSWYRIHSNILTFLETISCEQQMRVRGEDLLADPERYLREIAEWMQLRSDAEAIETMKHPELSPFASFGPRNAPMGGDANFFRDPALRTGKVKGQSLDGPLPWRQDGLGFREEVRDLARQFGYT